MIPQVLAWVWLGRREPPHTIHSQRVPTSLHPSTPFPMPSILKALFPERLLLLRAEELSMVLAGLCPPAPYLGASVLKETSEMQGCLVKAAPGP